jgi:hypothetical protein
LASVLPFGFDHQEAALDDPPPEFFRFPPF